MRSLEQRANAILALQCVGEDTKAVIRELLAERRSVESAVYKALDDKYRACCERLRQ